MGRGGRPGINFLVLGVADRKAQKRDICALCRAIADRALDDEDRLAVTPLCRGGKAVEMDAAKVHRQTEQGKKRRGLRHGPDQIGARADNRYVSERKCENKALHA